MIYDYIIAGAGLGGLSFIHHLIESGSSFSSVLIIDHDAKSTNDRTWSFWSEKSPTYKCAHQQSWSKLGFASDEFIRFDDISPYTYYTIRSVDFYQEVLNKVHDDVRFTFLQGSIVHIEGEENYASIRVGEHNYQTRYLIDSISKQEGISKDHLVLSQNFIGWKIRTKHASFDPKKPILMDFRVDQNNAPSFVYFLPYSETEALVEYTQFNTHFSFDKNRFEKEIENYISLQLGVSLYDVIELEKGSIPMTNYPFEARPHKRIFRIGTIGGDTKSTTGYTFMNVQRHAKSIVRELYGRKITIPEKDRFAFYDTLLLQIMHDQPLQVKQIMEFLFKKQPMSRVLKFLDEETTISEEMLIMGRLPWKPFLYTLLKRTQHAIIS
jgi:lycopene beta-cyclase